jgi:hypothetical protein
MVALSAVCCQVCLQEYLSQTESILRLHVEGSMDYVETVDESSVRRTISYIVCYFNKGIEE